MRYVAHEVNAQLQRQCRGITFDRWTPRIMSPPGSGHCVRLVNLQHVKHKAHLLVVFLTVGLQCVQAVGDSFTLVALKWYQTLDATCAKVALHPTLSRYAMPEVSMSCMYKQDTAYGASMVVETNAVA